MAPGKRTIFLFKCNISGDYQTEHAFSVSQIEDAPSFSDSQIGQILAEANDDVSQAMNEFRQKLSIKYRKSFTKLKCVIETSQELVQENSKSKFVRKVTDGRYSLKLKWSRF